jgi:hypothetical protein
MFDRTFNCAKFYQSFDCITVDQTNALRFIICSIEPLIVSSSIDPLTISQSIRLMYHDHTKSLEFDRSDYNPRFNQTFDCVKFDP